MVSGALNVVLERCGDDYAIRIEEKRRLLGEVMCLEKRNRQEF